MDLPPVQFWETSVYSCWVMGARTSDQKLRSAGNFVVFLGDQADLAVQHASSRARLPPSRSGIRAAKPMSPFALRKATLVSAPIDKVGCWPSTQEKRLWRLSRAPLFSNYSVGKMCSECYDILGTVHGRKYTFWEVSYGYGDG